MKNAWGNERFTIFLNMFLVLNPGSVTNFFLRSLIRNHIKPNGSADHRNPERNSTFRSLNVLKVNVHFIIQSLKIHVCKLHSREKTVLSPTHPPPPLLQLTPKGKFLGTRPLAKQRNVLSAMNYSQLLFVSASTTNRSMLFVVNYKKHQNSPGRELHWNLLRSRRLCPYFWC